MDYQGNLTDSSESFSLLFPCIDIEKRGVDVAGSVRYRRSFVWHVTGDIAFRYYPFNSQIKYAVFLLRRKLKI